MIIKRVVGEPGDQVIIDERGHIQVNQVPIVEPYVAIPAGPAGIFAVPQDHFLLLGDNRSHSIDSRGWRQPFLPTAAIQGRVFLGPRTRSVNFGDYSCRNRALGRSGEERVLAHEREGHGA